MGETHLILTGLLILSLISTFLLTSTRKTSYIARGGIIVALLVVCIHANHLTSINKQIVEEKAKVLYEEKGPDIRVVQESRHRFRVRAEDNKYILLVTYDGFYIDEIKEKENK
ncbi:MULTISPECIES: hypothetical protein [unclassified Psychrobacillus]|uniref:hypothetical protein n=1 Tax=unclassified Psychrobacillus TaxID=2636677 RepID=UPI0030F66322